MRRSLATLAALSTTLIIGHASADLIASDSFAVDGVNNNGDYNADRLFTQNPSVGATGFTGAWVNSPNQSTGDLAAVTGGLNAALVTGSTAPGNATTTGGSSVRNVFHQFSSVPSSSKYFYSFLLNSSGVSAQGAMGLTPLGRRDPEPTEGVRVGVEGGNIVLIVDSARTNILSNYATDTTYFVLVDITDNGAGVSDAITASVFSNTATDVSAAPLGTSATTGMITGELTSLNAAQKASGGAVTRFDEFRFGTELTDVVNVVVVPEPASLALLGLGTLMLLPRKRR